MRSRAGYVIGGVLAVAGVAGAALWFVASFGALGDRVDGFQRVPLPGEATMRLEARKYIVYYEGLGADEAVPPLRILITAEGSETPLPISPYGGSLTYSLSGREGSAIGTVTPTREGAYAVRTATNVSPNGASVAFGSSLAGPILRAILGTFAIGGVLIVAGITLATITGIRRSKTARDLIEPETDRVPQ